MQFTNLIHLFLISTVFSRPKNSTPKTEKIEIVEPPAPTANADIPVSSDPLAPVPVCIRVYYGYCIQYA